MDDVKALFALFTMAIFLNAFDKRTYLHITNSPSSKHHRRQWENDLNAISLLERRHYSYTRGLAFDLIHWFFNRYGLSMPDEEPDDAYTCLLAPFVAETGRNMVKYKFAAENNQHSGNCTGLEFEEQVKKAIFCFDPMQEIYEDMDVCLADDDDGIDDDVDLYPSFAFDFGDYDVVPYDSTQHFYSSIDDFFEFGKNSADCAYFRALESQF